MSTGNDWRVRIGHALEVLRTLEAGSVQSCVTSPPYWGGLRCYADNGQQWPAMQYQAIRGHQPLRIDSQVSALGQERTPDEYVGHLIAVFREVRRVLANDGTVWLNLGDCFLDKQQQGIPWRVALAMQADGWHLRSDIIWHKPNAMPESVTNRPTRCHELLYLLSKEATYYYDQAAVREPDAGRPAGNTQRSASNQPNDKGPGTGVPWQPNGTGRNARSVLSILAKPYPDAHFATFPPALPEFCIKASTRPGDLVLDPFNGAGTTGVVATRLRRRYLGIEQNPEYAELSKRRIEHDAPLFNR